MKPNKAAFDRVSKELADGSQLTFRMIGDVFGQPFWELIVMSFLDANDAARAIQIATLRLRSEGGVVTAGGEDIN